MYATRWARSLVLFVPLAACQAPSEDAEPRANPASPAPGDDPADTAADGDTAGDPDGDPGDTGGDTAGEEPLDLDPDDPLAQLYLDLRAKVERREAFSPEKEERIGFDPLAAMDRAAPELLAARTDTELYYALARISAARRDRHLRVQADSDLTVDGADDRAEAPIRFAPDFGTAGAYGVFVAAVDTSSVEGRAPAVGDRVVAVNGQPLAGYVADYGAYVSSSTEESLWWNAAEDLHERGGPLPPERYGDDLTLELRDADGATYTASVPWLDGEVELDTSARYPDMERVYATDTYDLYRHTGGREVLLLQWHQFKDTLEDDVDRLMAYAEDEDLLGYALIVDGTGSSGGQRSTYPLQRMTGRSFTCTFADLRLSDVIPELTERVRARVENGGSDADARVLDWLDGPVADAMAAGEDYTAPVPGQLLDLPHDADGVMTPAEVHFTGPLVVLLGPSGGSQLDQFAAMVEDNNLGHTIGMSTGGFSNSWEWTETITMPGTDRPLVDFMWSIGHTLRPNGEVLEGNPAQVDEYVPLTAENYASYHAELLERAYAHIDAELP